MKASEILRRYAKGERDFRRTNLRGQSFKKQDLSGADFTEADIRGANFTDATLRDTNFTNAIAGVQKRWLVTQLLLALLLASLSGFLQRYFGGYFAPYLTKDYIFKTYGFWLIKVIFIAFLIFLIGLTWAFQNLARVKAIKTDLESIVYVVIVGAALCAFSIAILITLVLAGTTAITNAGTNAGSIIVAACAAITGVIIGVVTIAIAVASAGFIAGGITGITIMAIANPSNSAISNSVDFPSNVVGLIGATLILSIYITTALLGEEFVLIRVAGVCFASIGGTKFCGANLTDANFTRAILKSTNFNHSEQQTFLDRVYWQDAQKLDRARFGDSILANPAVRDLLVTRNGYKKSYVDANFRTANLDDVNLEGANLTWATLSCATLRYANLKNANLLETLVLDTDFTGATLTGACLEAWNIDHNTKLNNVDCQYVYLLRYQQERRPSSSDFAPGEFTKLFQEVLSTVDLIFRNGIDWKAFAYSFNQLVLDNEGTELSIQSIENKGDGVVVVRVNAPADADKAKLHSEFNQTYDMAVKALEAKYHAELQAKDDQITIYRQKSADILEITRLMANRPINIQAIAEAKTMTNSNDSSQTVNIGGNVTGSTLNLGEISGAVTNTINQLPSSPDPAQPGIKELLTHLQAAIEAAQELSPEDKADALEQVKVVAELGQNPQNPEKEGIWRKAVKILKAPIPGLPETATIVKAFGDILPAIAKLLSLAV